MERITIAIIFASMSKGGDIMKWWYQEKLYNVLWLLMMVLLLVKRFELECDENTLAGLVTVAIRLSLIAKALWTIRVYRKIRHLKEIGLK